MIKSARAAVTGIQLPLDVDIVNRDLICRALLEVARHRLDDITIDSVPFEGAWPENARHAATELEGRVASRRSRWARAPKRPADPSVDLDPRSDQDFQLACSLAAHAWITAVSMDQSIALDTETFVQMWVTAGEYPDLVERVRRSGGDVGLLRPDPGLRAIYS